VQRRLSSIYRVRRHRQRDVHVSCVDDDGNLTQDGRWNYSWDVEDRLVTLSPSTSVGPQISLKFEYDSRGRRIRKQVWNNTTWNGAPASDAMSISGLTEPTLTDVGFNARTLYQLTWNVVIAFLIGAAAGQLWDNWAASRAAGRSGGLAAPKLAETPGRENRTARRA
jgi:hypothetical protein